MAVSKSAAVNSPVIRIGRRRSSHVITKLQFQAKLSRSQMSVGFSIKVTERFDVIRNLSDYGGRPIKARGIFANGPAIKCVCVAE